MDLVGDFEQIITLCEELEDIPISKRVKRRIANAYDRAVGKAVAIGWNAKTDPEVMDERPFRYTLMRHAERGARDFVE